MGQPSGEIKQDILRAWQACGRPAPKEGRRMNELIHDVVWKGRGEGISDHIDCILSGQGLFNKFLCKIRKHCANNVRIKKRPWTLLWLCAQGGPWQRRGYCGRWRGGLEWPAEV